MYTKEELDLVEGMRAEGYDWRTIELSFEAKFDRFVAHDTLRMALKNYGYKVAAAKYKAPKAPKYSESRSLLRPDPRRAIPDSTQYDRVLVISDMHVPYGHPDTVPFLTALKAHINPDKIVNIGDEIDCHAMSFHDSDPDLPSAGDELKIAIKRLKPIYKLFPEMSLVDSNHGSMVYRKGKHAGMARKFLRDYGEVLDAPEDWEWSRELVLNCSGNKVLFKHQFKKNCLQAAEQSGCCVVQGHFHEDFYIQYSGNSDRLIWAMTVACLIDDDTLAFTYNNTNLKRPIIGCGSIINGQPRLFPMLLSKGGRWLGKIV